MEKEIWKQVTGFENYYISNLGNVKSITPQKVTRY